MIEHVLEQYHRGCRVMKLMMELYYGSLKVLDLIVRPYHIKSSTFLGHWMARFIRRISESWNKVDIILLVVVYLY